MSRPTFFARYALLILVIIFFFVPFGIRGARFAVQGMKNDVKDWLPSSYTETKELDWFRRHFLGEQFVIATWDNCHGDEADERFKLFIAKLEPEMPPSAAKAAAEQQAEQTVDAAPESDESAAVFTSAVAATSAEKAASDNLKNPTRNISREGFIGDHLGLFTTDNLYENWGGRNEKWLLGFANKWYFITPDGDLYQWDGVDAPVASLGRLIQRYMGHKEANGTLMYSFGPVDGPWFYESPRRLRSQLFKTITTGPAVLSSLTREGGVLDGDLEEGHKRLAGTLFGPDGKQTCMILTLSDAARKDLHQVVGRGILGKPRGRLFSIAEESNIPTESLRLGGPAIDNVAIDEEGSITLVRLIGLCALLGLGLSLACFRSISATIMVFFIGGVSAIFSLAFVYWAGDSVDAIVMSMPALVYVLGLSGAAHIINYYKEAVADHGVEGACERATAHGWKPALFCNITTAIGLVSLYTSDIVPIRKFGLFAALGVMFTLILLFTYLPAALQLWPQNVKRREEGVPGDDQPWLDQYLAGFWNWLGSFCIRYHWLVAGSCVALIIGFSYGLNYIQTSVNLLKMFHKDAKIIQDYAWLENHLGPLVPMEIVLRVDKGSLLPTARDRADHAEDPNAQFQLSFLERLEIAGRVQQVVEEEFGPESRDLVGRAMSAVTFGPKLPKAKGDTGTFARRGATGRLLEAHRDEFLHSDYLRVDQDTEAELWRVSLRLGATRGVDYGAFVKELQSAVEPVLSAHTQRETILREVAERREGGRYVGAKVLLLGMPKAAFPAAKAEEESEEVAKPKLAATEPIDQTKIFARTLCDLLNVARMKVVSHIPDETKGLPENFMEQLAGFDCVVLVGDCSAYNVKAIRDRATHLVDATQHRYVHGQPDVRTANERGEKVAAVYTGIVPIVYKAQRALLDSLIQSTFWSFITITPLMIFISRSVSGGLVSMLPNVLPVVMVFGGMGWLGVEVDVGSMMTASIALGVAVDDTIHYLNWFREELDRLGDRHKAILATYKHCATPTFQAALISGLGLAIFALSTFTPTQRFGYLMLSILWMGVAAELIFFPAILAGPLGLVFKPRLRPAGSHGEEAAPAAAVSPEIALAPAFAQPIPAAASDDSPAGVKPARRPKSHALKLLRQDDSHRPRG